MLKIFKKIKVISFLGIFLALGVVTYVDTPSASAALTTAQKQACWDTWAGQSQGQAVANGGAKEFKEATFNKTPCAKQDSCNIMRYEDGATIHCFNPKTGKIDSNNVKNRPSADLSTVRTTGGMPDGCDDIKTSIIKCDGTGGNPVLGFVLQVVNFLAIGVGIAVVGGIVWGGMLYASSNGDSGKVQQGKMAIVNAIIGLLLFIFMYALINFIVPGGLFT